MVERPEGDDDERHVAVESDVGDCGQGVVSTGDPERALRRFAYELGRIVVLAQNPPVDAEPLGFGAQLVGVGALSRARIDDEEAAHRVSIANERRPHRQKPAWPPSGIASDALP
ncbi:MAG TPA: hypothetical protein VGJ40_03970 [Gaiellaceae bacterium]